MNPKVDYYEILGISETASPDEIKRAYRKLAKQYHPDSRGGDKAAEEKFKRISEAYSILSDSKKRQQYDMMRRGGFMGGEGMSFGGQSSPFDFNIGEGFTENLHDLFGNLFGNLNNRSAGQQSGDRINFEEMFQRKRPSHSRGNDMESTITVSFESAMNGGETIIKTGANKKIKIKIPAGIEDGKKIRIRGQGAPSRNGGPPGDLYLTIKVAPHPEFERRGLDIHSAIHVNIAEAILGTEALVKTISGKQVKLKIPAGTSSSKIFRLPGMGIRSQGKKGDHYVRVEIEVPRNLSISQKREFKNWAKKSGLLDQ